MLTQETVYKSILKSQREVFHERVARAMEVLYQEALDEYCEELAYHYDKSPNTGKAVEYLLKAAEKSREEYLNEESVGYFERALDRLGEGPADESAKRQKLEALRELAMTYLGMGLRSKMRPLLEEALVLGREVGLPAREMAMLTYRLATAFDRRSSQSVRVARQGLELLGRDTDCLEGLLMNYLYSCINTIL